MHAVEIRAITKTFGSHVAVDSLDLVVPEGSVYGFIGPNGSGKTTTLRMIMNILIPDRGTIQVLGRTLHSSMVDQVGYMPEERGLYRRMKVRELLMFMASLKGVKDPGPEVNRWLKAMDLAAWGDKKLEVLSKGMAQKVQFIATVVARPRLVLLDEPFAGLDPVNTEVLKDAIVGLQKDGTSVIFSTHDMSMAERMCDFVFMIFNGRKVLDGTLDQIQGEYGQDTIRVRTDGSPFSAEGIPGVARVNDFGNTLELRMSPGTDPRAVLLELLRRSRIQSFDIVRPSLHDIFVRIAAPEKQEAPHA